jgi:hypothetical protein
MPRRSAARSSVTLKTQVADARPLLRPPMPLPRTQSARRRPAGVAACVFSRRNGGFGFETAVDTVRGPTSRDCSALEGVPPLPVTNGPFHCAFSRREASQAEAVSRTDRSTRCLAFQVGSFLNSLKGRPWLDTSTASNGQISHCDRRSSASVGVTCPIEQKGGLISDAESYRILSQTDMRRVFTSLGLPKDAFGGSDATPERPFFDAC